MKRGNVDNDRPRKIRLYDGQPPVDGLYPFRIKTGTCGYYYGLAMYAAIGMYKDTGWLIGRPHNILLADFRKRVRGVQKLTNLPVMSGSTPKELSVFSDGGELLS